MKTIEQRMKALEEASSRQSELLTEIHAVLTTGRIPKPTRPEYDRAIRALLAGDKGPLDLYLARGGELPEHPTKPFIPYSPRKKAAAAPPLRVVNVHPVMLPDKERGASSVNGQPTTAG